MEEEEPEGVLQDDQLQEEEVMKAEEVRITIILKTSSLSMTQTGDNIEAMTGSQELQVLEEALDQ